MDTIGKRLKYYLENNHESVTEFSEKTEIPVTSVYRTFKSDKGINSTTLTKIIECYPDLDIIWLLTGVVKTPEKKTTHLAEEGSSLYQRKEKNDLKERVLDILSNDIILETFIEILKRHDKKN